jgi:2-hydroxymuconate-semialdehyde hydrolase
MDRHRARVSAGELAYVDEGDGPAVVLLHGFPTSADLWRNLAPLLAPRFRVIAPDLLGYGQSERPTPADLSVPAQATYVRELLGHLGLEEFAVVGHGLGGAVGQLLAPGGGRTLVLMNSATLDSSNPGPEGPLRHSDPGAADERMAERAVREAFERGTGHPERMAQEDLELFVRPWRADPPALVRAAQAFDKGGRGAAEHVSSNDRLGDLRMPAFLVWGEDDPWFPASVAERLQELLPEAALALLPGCSHFVLEDAQETVVPMVFEFLRLRYLGEHHAHAPSNVVAPADLGVSFERPQEPPGLPDEEA